MDDRHWRIAGVALHQQWEIEALALSLVVAPQGWHVELDVTSLSLGHVGLDSSKPILQAFHILLIEKVIDSLPIVELQEIFHLNQWQLGR